MGYYSLRPLGVREYGSYHMLQVISSFNDKAEPAARQRTIEYLARQHGMNLTTTKSLRYDPTFHRRAGVNVKGDIRIGPSAFSEDSSWLANVIFHEVIHSDQFDFYAQHGVVFRNQEASSEPERVMVALDEFEGFYWPWRNSGVLALSDTQKAALEREVRLWQIEIDDAETIAFTQKGQFDDARLALMERLHKNAA